MDFATEDATLQAILGRSDFVGGIDNEALDFSQLEAFINSGDGGPEGNTGPAAYFADTLQADNSGAPGTPTNTVVEAAVRGKLVNVIVDNKRQGHHLPESPPDSGSEHPYSPADTTEHHSQQLAPDAALSNGIYTTLSRAPNPPNAAQPSNGVLFKHHHPPSAGNGAAVGAEILNPILTPVDHILLTNHPQIQHHQMIIGSAPQTPNRCIDTTQGCVLVQAQAPDNQAHHMLQTPRGEFSNRNEFKLSLGHDLDTVMIQSPLGPRVTLGTPLPQPQMDTSLENMQAVYTNLQNVSKKRKISQDIPLVKSEPELSTECTPRPAVCSPLDPAEEYSLDVSVGAATSDSNGGPGSTSGGLYVDSAYQCIRFSPFQQSKWHVLTDQHLKELPIPYYRVDADKGFNFSNADDAFVCQKKNHFQITCHAQLQGDAQFVKTNEGLKKISSFYLHFYGVKYESPDQTIKVEQSQSDRSKKPFHPVLVELQTDQVTKVTVGRLHFSETTSNNMRKKGKPNPEQRYFQLVVGLYAHTTDEPYPVTSLASERIIVRASNPGQFESDIEPCWQKGQTNESIYHAGKVGINTDRPDESLVIHGNLKLTGHIVQPSDLRAKQNITECNTAEQLRNVQKLRVVRYKYQPEFALHSGLIRDSEHVDTGVIAQEVADVLPEAVSAAGSIVLPNGNKIDNFLVVNKERIFMENVGAVKELCKVTDNLENRIDQLERINRRLSKLKRGDSLKSTASTVTNSKHIHTQKCYIKQHNHKCSKEPEICSNKLIQIIIVILVLIMAFCLAAITTLYLIESQHHSNRFHEKFAKNFNKVQTMKPTFTDLPYATSAMNSVRENDAGYLASINNVKHSKHYQKTRPWIKDNAMPTIDNSFSNAEIRTQPINDHSTESTNSLSLNIGILKPPIAVGRPAFCHSDSELDGSSCQIYCCIQETDTNSAENVDTSLIEDDKQNGEFRVNNSAHGVSLAGEKATNTKSIHSNNISKKEIRTRRDTYLRRDIFALEEENIYSDNLETIFSVVLQGRHFNVTLGPEYCYECSLPMNLTYTVPISKYMSDEFIFLKFQNLQANIKDLEFCVNNAQQSDCQPGYWGEQETEPKNTKESILSQIDERNGFRTHGKRFEVDMIGFLDKLLTYRAPLLQKNQNICDLPASKLGIDFLEYNFHFYRDCED